jgi:hypothetical protein
MQNTHDPQFAAMAPKKYRFAKKKGKRGTKHKKEFFSKAKKPVVKKNSNVAATDLLENCETLLQVPINKLLFVIFSFNTINCSKLRGSISWSDCYRWRWSCRLTICGSIGSIEEDERENMDAFFMV